MGCNVREKIIITEGDNDFAETERQKEVARAVKELIRARSFILITADSESGCGISGIEGRDIVSLLAGIRKMGNHLTRALKKIGEDYDNEKEG